MGASINSSDRECVGIPWWMEKFQVSKPTPFSWLSEGQLPLPLGRLGTMRVWWRHDADRFLEILREQTDVPLHRTNSAERRQAVKTFLAEKAEKSGELETA